MCRLEYNNRIQRNGMDFGCVLSLLVYSSFTRTPASCSFLLGKEFLSFFSSSIIRFVSVAELTCPVSSPCMSPYAAAVRTLSRPGTLKNSSEMPSREVPIKRLEEAGAPCPRREALLLASASAYLRSALLSASTLTRCLLLFGFGFLPRCWLVVFSCFAFSFCFFLFTGLSRASHSGRGP